MGWFRGGIAYSYCSPGPTVVIDVDAVMPLRTLLVEDSHSEAALIARLLRMAGAPRFDVTTVHNHAEAEAVIGQRRMDLIVLDLGLPDALDELDALKRLRRQSSNTPIVVLTGVAPSEELRQDVMDAGASACIFKESLSPEGLHRVLHIAARRGEAQPRAEDLSRNVPE